MGLTKQYLRYAPKDILGIIAGSRCNIQSIKYRGFDGKHVAVGACQFVFIWDLKKAEAVLKLECEGDLKSTSEVTRIEQNPNKHNKLAVGYLDGSIRIFDLYSKNNDPETNVVISNLTFNGHKSSITCLSFDNDGVRLVSGSKDTDIVVWDLVGECGLFRLKAHKAPISKIIFMNRKNVLISAAKDMLIKFWDIDTRHCFKTIVCHKSEVNDMILLNNEERLITGCHDNELRVFEITFKESIYENASEIQPGLKKLKINCLDDEKQNFDSDDEGTNETVSVLNCELIGSLIRESKDQLSQLCVDKSYTIFSAHSANEKQVELFKINTKDEIKKRLSKKLKKQKRKLVNDDKNSDSDNNDELVIDKTVKDEFTRIALLKTRHKVKYVDICCEFNTISKNKQENREVDQIQFDCKIACLLQNNQIEVYMTEVSRQINNTETPILIYSISNPGHRTDVRTICFSSDSTAFISASGDSLKVWNRMSLNCIRSFTCDYALCSLFLSDDNHVLLGTKSGKIQLFNISVANMLENVIGHEEESAIWSITLIPDKSGFATGGADKSVKFWGFELIDDEENQIKKRLSFKHIRTLKLDDDILCVKISPNGRLIAVALLDTTVKVFFMDSLKLFLNMYGHKQPVLTMDISFDNKIIITGSSDRHIKVWGMDFGDCHRSLFAHEDSVMNVSFVGKTHYFFSVGKDGKLKEWDADKFEKIVTLNGHLSEIWTMAVSHDGKYVITSSHDKSMRVWEKTNEPLILEDERENEKEQDYENELPKEVQIIAGEQNTETSLATIKTIETIKSAEKIIEALNIYLEEQHKMSIYLQAVSNLDIKEAKNKIKLEEKHPILIAYNNISAEDYLLDILKKTKASEIETTLLILDFDYVKILLELLLHFLRKKQDSELCLKCAIFLLKINFGQITTTQLLLPFVEDLKSLCNTRITELQDSFGFNLAAIKFLKLKVEEIDQVNLFADISLKLKEKTKKNKKSIKLLSLNSASVN